jgi:hypothetical protein
MKKMKFIATLLTVLVFANISFASVTLDMSTGVNVGVVGNPVYTMPSTKDDNWMVRSILGTNQPPNTKSWLMYGMGAWNSIPGTLPIWANTNATGTSEFERCFCISNLEGAKLDITLRADNKANLFLNSYFGNPILQTITNNTFNTATPAATMQYTAQNGLKVGKNCLRVRLNNESGPTGFALKAVAQVAAGQDTYRDGNSCCQQGSPVFAEQFKVAASGDVIKSN